MRSKETPARGEAILNHMRTVKRAGGQGKARGESDQSRGLTGQEGLKSVLGERKRSSFDHVMKMDERNEFVAVLCVTHRDLIKFRKRKQKKCDVTHASPSFCPSRRTRVARFHEPHTIFMRAENDKVREGIYYCCLSHARLLAHTIFLRFTPRELRNLTRNEEE